MKSLLVTGGNGLIGSSFVESTKDRYTHVPLDISHPEQPIDITNAEQVAEVFKQHPDSVCVHFAAFTDVTAAWNQRGDTNGIAYTINVTGTENIVKAALEYNIHLVHISTAYVFDGHNPEMYTESDTVNPIEWYGYTKAKAEECVLSQEGLTSTVLRIDQPFRTKPFAKPDIVQKMAHSLHKDSAYPFFTDHWFGPTFIEDFVIVLEKVIKQKLTGLYHATSSEKWNDFDFAHLIARSHSIDTKIFPGSLTEYQASSERPYQINTALNSSLLYSKLNWQPTSIREAVKKVTLSSSADSHATE